MPPLGTPTVAVNAIAAVTVPSQTETVIATSAPVSTQNNAQRVALAMLAIAHPNNVDVTSLVFKVRRTSLTGTQVGATVTANVPADAGGAAVNPYVLDVLDTPGDVSGLVYVVTVATGAGAGTLGILAGGAIVTTVY